MPQNRPYCRITLRGSFNVKWADYFGEILLGLQVAEGEIQTTTLLGHPIDLTAFISTLNLLNDRHFPILACEYQQAGPISAAIDDNGEPVLRSLQPDQEGE